MGDAKDFVGMYGACVATIVFIWDIAKWFYQKPRLRIEIKTDMALDPSGKYLIRDPQNTYPHDKKGIAIEIINIGGIPTTLKFIALQPYKKIFLFKNRHDAAGPLTFSKTSSEFPKILNPGEIWSGYYFDQTNLFELQKQFKLFIEVHHSFSEKPAVKKLMFLVAKKPCIPRIIRKLKSTLTNDIT